MPPRLLARAPHGFSAVHPRPYLLFYQEIKIATDFLFEIAIQPLFTEDVSPEIIEVTNHDANS
jgi:hypothetical protein